MPLCLADLVDITQGQVHFGPMPPLYGLCTPLGDIALESRHVALGDVFWRIPGLACQQACSPQDALFRGAAGIVTGDEAVSPLPGTFVLEVEDPAAALAKLLDFLDQPAVEQDSPELKVLQLCPPQAPDITPPTCGRSAESRIANRRCRRAA